MLTNEKMKLRIKMINTKLFSMFWKNLDFNSYLMFTCTINCFSFILRWVFLKDHFFLVNYTSV